MALLAHQLKTPLSTINALAQGLVRRSDRLSNHEVRSRAEKIWRASVHLNELIDTILSYSQASAGGIFLRPVAFSLEDLIRRVCQEQANQDPDRTFKLDLRDLPPIIMGDPILLEQALLIVLSNATKYSPQDRPIGISTRSKDGTISIIVEDKGIGVTEWDMPFLMQPFFRGRNATDIPGTGLGLSLAWHILKLHGGSLHIKSKEGHGTTVTMTLLEQVAI